MADGDDQDEIDERGLPPCLECGRCCTGPKGWVTLAWHDLESLSEEKFESLTCDHQDDGVYTRVMRQREDGSCVALDRTRDGRFVCTIYPLRPAVCRLFARGSPECRDAFSEAPGATP